MPVDDPNFPKANTHVHLEAAISVEVLAALADKYGVELPAAYKQGEYQFTDLGSFIQNYDELNTHFIRSAEDYYLITKDYLARMAKDGVIYTDLIVSPAHGIISNIEYPELIQAINRAIEEVPAIEATMSLTAVRSAPDHEHYGAKNALKWAKTAAKYKNEPWHQRVTALGIAGYEFSTEDHFADYAEAMRVASEEGGLKRRVHAGESKGHGPQSVLEALKHLEPHIIDHGCEIAYSPELQEKVKSKGIFVTCCPRSNGLLIENNKDASAYMKNAAFWVLRDKQIACALGDDDPVFFGNTITGEYRDIQTLGKLSDAEMLEFTRNAIAMPNVPEAMKQRLNKRLAEYC